MERSAFERGAGSNAERAGANWISLHKVLVFMRSVKGPRSPQQLAVETEDIGSISPTQPNRALGHGLKDRLKIERRAADDLKHVGCGCLLLQSLRKVGGALAQFIEQSRVLDSDDRLGGEVRDQSNLLVGK